MTLDKLLSCLTRAVKNWSSPGWKAVGHPDVTVDGMFVGVSGHKNLFQLTVSHRQGRHPLGVQVYAYQDAVHATDKPHWSEISHFRTRKGAGGASMDELALCAVVAGILCSPTSYWFRSDAVWEVVRCGPSLVAAALPRVGRTLQEAVVAALRRGHNALVAEAVARVQAELPFLVDSMGEEEWTGMFRAQAVSEVHEA